MSCPRSKAARKGRQRKAEASPAETYSTSGRMPGNDAGSHTAEYSWWLMDAVISMTSVQIDLICAYLVESWFFRMTPMSKHLLQTLRYVSRTPG